MDRGRHRGNRERAKSKGLMSAVFLTLRFVNTEHNAGGSFYGVCDVFVHEGIELDRNDASVSGRAP